MFRKHFQIAAVLLVLCSCATAQTWVASWASSQQLPEPQNALPESDSDLTLRQIVHLSVGGKALRVHLSNRFGAAPLRFTDVHVARASSPQSSEIVAGSDTPLHFSGQPDVIVPAGADYVSDALPFAAVALSDLTITLHLETLPARQTGHPGSRATSYVATGNLVSAAQLPDAKKVEHWYFVAAVDVEVPRGDAVVTLGDSITDGHGATTNGNDRWPDVLARRLQASAATRDIAVLNQGIGGNRLLLDGLGPNALARVDHDVLAPAGVRYAIVLEGINDIGTLAREHDVPQEEHDALVRRMIAAYEQIIYRAHARGIRVFGATLTPFVGSGYYHPSAASEADRQAVNRWIREPGHFDAVIDFDQVTRDPEQPDRLLAKFDSGDHLHPSPAGYAAMGEAVQLSLFNTGARPARRTSSSGKASR
jgi:lysophospholipase L1-like esterase